MLRTKNSTESNIYSISRKPFYKWISRNLPQFKDIDVLEIDEVTFELWESIHKNFTQSNITISSPVENRVEYAKSRYSNYQVNFTVEHSYRLSYSDKSLDLIISNNNNFIKNSKTVSEVIRVLRDGGYFINIVNGDDHIIELKNLFYKGRHIERKVNEGHLVLNCRKALLESFKSVSFREYNRELHIKSANDVLGYYLSNRNPRVRKWALEDSNWILQEVNKEIASIGYFKISICFGMFVCK